MWRKTRPGNPGDGDTLLLLCSTILYCFICCYAATNRSNSEIQREYSYLRSVKLASEQSVLSWASETFFLSSNCENFALFFRIFTLYSKSLPLDLACRVWDVFCRDGEEFLFRTALGILKLFEDILTKMDFIHIAQFLTKLPEDLPSEEFFTSIAAIQMQSRNKKWAQVKRMLSWIVRWMYGTREEHCTPSVWFCG